MRCIGFTTKTFMKGFKDFNKDTVSTIQWGAQNGFSWVEIRDNDASMSTDFVKELKSMADVLGMRLHYAWDGGDLMFPNDKEMLLKALENAAILGPGTISRITLSLSCLYNTGRMGYTKEQFERICIKLKEYDEISKGYGVILAYENGYEPLYGDNKTYFGMAEFVQECPFMSLVFDAGNVLNKIQVVNYADWEDVKKFYIRYKNNISYLHIKTTKDHILQNTLLNEGDVDLKWLVGNTTSGQWLCLELPGADDAEETKKSTIEALAVISGYCK